MFLSCLRLVYCKSIRNSLFQNRGSLAKTGSTIRACASAIARLVYTVFYFRSDDTAYTLSALSLWLIAEMTCMFLIFAGPATPSAFAKSEWMAKLKRTFKSWSKGSSKQNTEATDRPWAPKADAMNLRKAYRKLDEFELLATNATSGGETTRDSAGDMQDYAASKSGILCTKEFTTMEERVQDDTQLNRNGQPPWGNIV